MFLKTAAQAFEAGDFRNIFLRFWGFRGLFSYKNVSYRKKRVCNFSFISLTGTLQFLAKATVSSFFSSFKYRYFIDNFNNVNPI